MTTDAHRKAKRKYYNKNKALLRRFKKLKGCAHCGYKEHAAALQFDHIVPIRRKTQKDGQRSVINTLQGLSKKTMKIRLQELQVLCANCHSIKTEKDRLERLD